MLVADTQLVQMVFTGKSESTYHFYSVAQDNAGNEEPAPAELDAEIHTGTLGLDRAKALENDHYRRPSPILTREFEPLGALGSESSLLGVGLSVQEAEPRFGE